jgi:hypothetical protein
MRVISSRIGRRKGEKTKLEKRALKQRGARTDKTRLFCPKGGKNFQASINYSSCRLGSIWQNDLSKFRIHVKKWLPACSIFAHFSEISRSTNKTCPRVALGPFCRDRGNFLRTLVIDNVERVKSQPGYSAAHRDRTSRLGLVEAGTES